MIDKNSQKYAVAIVLAVAVALTGAILLVEMIGCGTPNLAVCNFGVK